RERIRGRRERREEQDEREPLHLCGVPASGDRSPKIGARSRSANSATAMTRNTSAKPAFATTQRGRSARASGNTAPSSSSQPRKWCRKDERWNTHWFCDRQRDT